MRRCEDEKVRYRPPLLEEPCAQTLSGKMLKKKKRRSWWLILGSAAGAAALNYIYIYVLLLYIIYI